MSGRFTLPVSILISFLLTSCELFNKDVKEFFVKYTETAAIEKDYKTASIGKSIYGIDCIESNEDKSITFYLRNPQHYRLNFSYEFDHKKISEHFSSYATDGTITYTQSEDSSVMTMTFARSFLHELEMGAIPEYDEDGNPTEKCIKDISGTIHIVEAETLREFESYHLELAVNTAPPRMRGAVIQRDKPLPNSTGETAHFIVCFNIKNLNNTVHQNDTKDLYIGSELYKIDFSGGSIAITDEEGNSSNLKLSTTAPTSLYNVDGADTVFAAGTSSEGYLPLYYTTDINADSVTAANAVSYKIQLKDFDGFDTASTVYNVTDRLRPPQVNVNAASTEYAADDVTGTFDLVISHSGECYHNENGTEVAGDAVAGTPTIIYEVYNASGTVVAEGSKVAPVTVPVEIGKYYVKAYALCTGYIDSDYMADDEEHCTSLANAFTVHRSQNFYVNKTGNNGTYNGSKNKPYRTIQKCIDQIRDMAANDPTDNYYSIIIQSDLTVASTDSAETLADFTNGVSSDELVYYIEGNGYTINAAGKTLAAKIGTSTNVDFDNVNISGAGILVDSGILKFESGSVKNVSSSSAGCAIKATSGELYLGTEGIVTVSGNTCTAEETPCAVYIGGSATCGIAKAVIYNNKDADNNPANLYLPKVGDEQKTVSITGEMTGSQIGVNTESVPDAGNYITFTTAYGYNGGNNSSVTPGTYFIGDTEGVGFDAATGEAVLAKNGGTFNINFEDDITFALESMYVPYHTEKEMKIIVTNRRTVGSETTETDVTADCTDFNYSLCYFGDDIGSTYYTNSTTCSFTIKNTLRSGTYKLFVSCKYHNVLYSQELEVGVRTTDEFYVSENGDDSNSGLTAQQPLKTFGKALKLFEGSGSTNFLTIYVSGNVQLGDISGTERTNALNATIPSLRIESPTGGSINGGSATILRVNSPSAVVIKNVKLVNDESTYALKLENAKAKLTVQGKTALGKVHLANGAFINADSSLELPVGVEKYGVVTPARQVIGTQVISGDWTKFNHFELALINRDHRELDYNGRIAMDYEFVPSKWDDHLIPYPDELSDDDIIGLINGGSAKNGKKVWSDQSLLSDFARDNGGYDQRMWAKMVGTTVVFKTNAGVYGVMTLTQVYREKVSKKNKMMRAYWRMRRVGETAAHGHDTRGMDSKNSDIDSGTGFQGEYGGINDIHTFNGNAINGAEFYILHHGHLCINDGWIDGMVIYDP